MIANVFISQKHQNSYISLNPTNKIVALKLQKNDVTRQIKFVGDSYNSKTTPSKYATISITVLKPLWEMCCASANLT